MENATPQRVFASSSHPWRELPGSRHLPSRPPLREVRCRCGSGGESKAESSTSPVRMDEAAHRAMSMNRGETVAESNVGPSRLA